MHKYLLSMVLLSLPAAAMYSEISTHDEQAESTPPAQPPFIVSHSAYVTHRWHEIEAVLSNDDVITYTRFPAYNNSSHCIHAKKHDATHEKRENASPYWVHQMTALYNARLTPNAKKIYAL